MWVRTRWRENPVRWGQSKWPLFVPSQLHWLSFCGQLAGRKSQLRHWFFGVTPTGSHRSKHLQNWVRRADRSPQTAVFFAQIKVNGNSSIYQSQGASNKPKVYGNTKENCRKSTVNWKGERRVSATRPPNRSLILKSGRDCTRLRPAAARRACREVAVLLTHRGPQSSPRTRCFGIHFGRLYLKIKTNHSLLNSTTQ